MQKKYSVKQLAELAGVSVRALHIYHRLGLLIPCERTEAGYRLYGENELLRLQQILFYKELDFSLEQIREILSAPDYNILSALEHQKSALRQKKEQINQMVTTIDKTIKHLKKEKIMKKHEELYAGLSKEIASQYRNEAIEKYGKEAIEQSEKSLLKLSKAELEELKLEQIALAEKLRKSMNLSHENQEVQKLIALHYAIIRKFWGTANSPDKQAEAYAGLGNLYMQDERFTALNGIPQPEYAAFLCKAMQYFAQHNLK